MKTNSKKPASFLIEFFRTFPNEQSCREYLAKARWSGAITCPHCHADKVYTFKNGRLYKCAKCQKQFTVRIGTIFEDSALPLQKWFMAVFLLTAHKKGISSCQLARDIEVTQKTAWFMLHRIRYAIKTKSFLKPLNGTVEIDETYVGGKTHGMGGGYSHPNKTPVFGMLERGGDVRAMPVVHANGKNLKPIIRANVDKDAVIMTDTFGGYRGLDKEYKAHHTVNHEIKEYGRGEVHTNNIEGFWSLMKRGIRGVQHNVSKKHLHRYTDEYAYRYNSRKISDVERFHSFFHHCSGRLTHKELVD